MLLLEFPLPWENQHARNFLWLLPPRKEEYVYKWHRCCSHWLEFNSWGLKECPIITKGSQPVVDTLTVSFLSPRTRLEKRWDLHSIAITINFFWVTIWSSRFLLDYFGSHFNKLVNFEFINRGVGLLSWQYCGKKKCNILIYCENYFLTWKETQRAWEIFYHSKLKCRNYAQIWIFIKIKGNSQSFLYNNIKPRETVSIQ